jgi:pimeloyl-ACP methyl ester carboxylesterase
MTEPRLNHVQCLDTRGLHRMAYWEWGDAANPRVLVCVHGLSRQGRDFDVLARAMCGEYRVVCPDVVGRGESDALADPMGYQLPAYVADMVTLLARLDAMTLHWVGTSMGGLIGLALASMKESPVSRLVLNDVGPAIRYEAIERIATYLGAPLRWNTVEEAADYLWSISQGFGPHTRDEWLALTRPMLKPDGAGGFKPHYDANIALPFKALTREMVAGGEAMTWHAYDAIRCPTLVLRGADSDLLTHETAQSMTQRGPKARLREFAGVGHAPTLGTTEQVQAVREFLLS